MAQFNNLLRHPQSIYDVKVISYYAATRWIKKQGKEVELHSLGGRTKTTYYASVFDGCILLHYQARRAHEFILRKENWDKFLSLYARHEHTARVLGRLFKDWGCYDRSFWPCVLVISKAYNDSRSGQNNTSSTQE